MVEKIYDKVKSIAVLNQIAAGLRRLGMKEELENLAKKFFVPQDNVTLFFEGKRYFLMDGGNTSKIYGTAKAKLLDEMFSLKDHTFGDVIGKYLLSCCQDPLFETQILLHHKTLQRCIEYLMEQAYNMVSEDAKKSHQRTCTAVLSEQVFSWVKDYYFLDDCEVVKKEMEEKNKKFLESLESHNKSRKSSDAKKKVLSGSGKAKAQGKINKVNADQNEKQISLFEVGLAE